MRKEDELYIELHLSTVLSLCLEADYSIDKIGNLTFKDKNKVKEKINKAISDSAEELEASEEEIRDYLINIYRNKCSNPNFINQGTELISILEESQEEKSENNKVSEVEKNNTERS